MVSNFSAPYGRSPSPSAEGQPFAPTMDYYIPQWEERTSYGMRRIDPYTKLFEDRIIFLGTPISDEIANAVMAQLLCLQQMDADRDIEIYINSPGGSFTALTAIYDTMRYIKPDVRTVCLGQAASAAPVANASMRRMVPPPRTRGACRISPRMRIGTACFSKPRAPRPISGRWASA